MSRPRLFTLGAPDPEMLAIERLLAERGQPYAHATAGGVRVSAGTAYSADPVPADAVPWGGDMYFVECLPAGDAWPTDSHGAPVTVRFVLRAGVAQDDATGADYLWVWRLDHHRPGDLGYGRPPAEYWGASSLGQVCARLGVSGTAELRMVAAADHCLAAAYRGECPGVDQDTLMRWRAESRAAHQRRPVAAVLADVDSARDRLRAAPRVTLGGVAVADMRPGAGAPDAGGWGDVPELPEAAARDGVAFLAVPRPGADGRRKLVLQAAPPEAVASFLRGEGPAAGTTERYGDPARGFAGGYLA